MTPRGEVADGPRPRLYRLVARLLDAHELRDRLVRESAEAKVEMGEVPADLIAALSDVESVLLAVEGLVANSWKPASVSSSHAGDESLSAVASVNHGSSISSTAVDDCGETIALLEETLTVSKLRRVKGRVRVTTRTDVTEAMAEVELDRYRVEVTRVPVGRIVDEAPLARAEGDTTVIPVVEERFVVVKQLFLVEELRIRHVVEREAVSEPVTLRRQRAVVERLDVAANSTDLDGMQPE